MFASKHGLEAFLDQLPPRPEDGRQAGIDADRSVGLDRRDESVLCTHLERCGCANAAYTIVAVQ